MLHPLMMLLPISLHTCGPGNRNLMSLRRGEKPKMAVMAAISEALHLEAMFFRHGSVYTNAVHFLIHFNRVSL